MENKENKIEAKLDEGKSITKYKMSKKTLFSIVGIIGCIALIVVLSLTSAVFDPEIIKQTTYWINVILSCAICIFGMITGQQMGDDMSRNNPKGQFRKSLGKYAVNFKKVDDGKMSSYFEEWLDIYRQKKLFRKKRRILKDNGVHQMEVLDLDVNELSNLKTPFKKDWKHTPSEDKYYNEETKESITYFLSYTDEQIAIIKKCIQGEIKVSSLPKSFFMDALNQSEVDIWESAANSNKKKSLYLSSSYIYRLLALVSVSVILAGLRPESYEEFNPATAALNVIARLFTLSMAVIWGIYIGFELVKIDISFIDFKTDMLGQYANDYEKEEFKPESINEKAKRVYEKYEASKPKVDIVFSDDNPSNNNTIMLENKEE